jgi:hypothetical protein
MLLLRTPSFASVLANSLPLMHVGAQTLCMVVLCSDHMMKCTIDAIMCLSGWWCWVDGQVMWLFMRYILLRLSEYICLLCEVFWVLAIASHNNIKFGAKYVLESRNCFSTLHVVDWVIYT